MKPEQNTFESIEGWLTPAEGAALQEMARDKNVLEIGMWKGRSAIAMAHTARNVISVDYFLGDGYTGKASTYFEAIENTKKVADNITIIIGPMERTIRMLDLNKFDCFYYDADHDAPVVENILPYIMVTGKPIAFHDYERVPTYIKSVNVFDRLCGQYNYEMRLVNRLALISKQTPMSAQEIIAKEMQSE